MGVDYSAQLVFGYEFSAAELDVFKRVLPEKSHMEPRWDPKTGKPSVPERVVDRKETTAYVLDGDPYDCIWEIAEAVAAKVGCAYYAETNSWSGECGSVYFGFNIDGAGSDLGRFTVNGYATMDELITLNEQMPAIAGKLVGLGLKPARPVVTVAISVS